MRTALQLRADVCTRGWPGSHVCDASMLAAWASAQSAGLAQAQPNLCCCTLQVIHDRNFKYLARSCAQACVSPTVAKLQTGVRYIHGWPYIHAHTVRYYMFRKEADV